MDDGTRSAVYFDFGCLSRSIEIGSTSFEYDRFVKYVHHGFGHAQLCPASTKRVPSGTPLEFPGPPK